MILGGTVAKAHARKQEVCGRTALSVVVQSLDYCTSKLQRIVYLEEVLSSSGTMYYETQNLKSFYIVPGKTTPRHIYVLIIVYMPGKCDSCSSVHK